MKVDLFWCQTYCLCLSGRVELGVIVPIEDDLYLPLCVLLSTQIGLVSHPYFIQPGDKMGNYSASHTLRSVDWLVDSCGSRGLSFLTQPVCACYWFGSSLTSQTLSFHSTDCFQYQLHGHMLKATGAVERKSKE